MGAKKQEEPSKKVVKKMQEKIIEDKTFGLKNKNKSAKVQQYVKQVENQVKHGQVKGGASALEQQKYAQAADKKKKEEADALLASLFKNAQSLSAKQTSEEIKESQQIDLYKDPRQGTEDMPLETIITCKNFLDAVEDEKYGWRWECGNGAKCPYRHQLPEGFIVISKKEREKMKKDGKAAQEEEEAKTIEERIEEERAALPSDGLTPVTKESFFAWKARRAEQKQKLLEDQLKEQEEQNAKGKKLKSGKNSVMNGRALFTYNPDLFQDDENAGGEDLYQILEEKVPEPTKVDESLFAGEVVDEEVDFD